MFLLALQVTNRYSYLPMVKTFLPFVVYRNIGYVWIIREKMEIPPVQFRALLLRLLGDKDQERVSEIVSKVEKHFSRQRPQHVPPMSRYSPRGRGGTPPWTHARCFYCNKIGHFQSHCLLRRGDGQVSGNARPLSQPNNAQSQ